MGQLSLCSVASLPCRLIASHKVFHKTVKLLTTTSDVESMTQCQGVPDHQVLPVGGGQHVQAFCNRFSGDGVAQCLKLAELSASHHLPLSVR